MGTKVGVFIIESRKIEEEIKGKRQGLILTEMMTLLGIKSEYRYIRTIKELNEMVRQYYDSNFRYLHFSMHGVSRNGEPINKFSLSLDQITYSTFTKALINNDMSKIGKRRLFISACNVMDDIAILFDIKDNSFISIIAPSKTIKTRIAPLAWATFYNRMFSIENESMTNTDIRITLNKICNFFNVKFKAFFMKKDSTDQYEIYSFPNKKC